MAEASDVRSRFRRSSDCTGRNVSERRASLEKAIAQADRTTLSGKADTVGETSEEYPQSLRRGSGDSMYKREARATREAPWRGQR
jgi:hypothetical protein